MEKSKITGFALLIAAFLIVGCGAKGESIPPNASPEEPVAQTQTAESAKQTGSDAAEQEISLYFASEDASCLVETRRAVHIEKNQTEDMAKAVITELIAGPDDALPLCSVMPEGTKLQSVAMESDGTLCISLNRAFVDAQYGGSAGMMMTLYSVVDSLACLDGVEAVRILIEGKAVEAYEGLISPDEPVQPWENVATK